MLNSLQSKILFALTGTVLVAILSLLLLFLYNAENQVGTIQNNNAYHLLDTVNLAVENQYKSLLFHKASSLEKRKHELKNIITLAIIFVEDLQKKVEEGLLTEAEAKKQAIEGIRRMRFDDNVGYIWINDMTRPIPTMIMHPTIPELDGQVLDDPKFNCASGTQKNLFQAFVEVCAEQGHGFVDYLWPKPTADGLTSEQPKLSYVKLFKPWGWVVGTGMYIDDLEKDMQARLNAILVDLKETLSRVKHGEFGYMFLFNGKKEVLIPPLNSTADFSRSINRNTGKLLLDELIVASTTQDKHLDYTISKSSHGRQKQFSRKKAQVMYFAPLDWYIVSAVDANEFDQPAKLIIRDVLILASVILLCAFFLSLRLSKSLSRPLRKLSAAAQGIDYAGIAKADIPVTGTVETRNLGKVLNTMLASIRKSALSKEEHLKTDLATTNLELIESNRNLQKEIEERKIAEDANLKLERQLLRAEKLEAVGRLAAGIAHEVNTPSQYVSTNLEFLKEATDDLNGMLANITDILEKAHKHKQLPDDLFEKVKLELEEADWDYLRSEVPSALNQSEEGIRRITALVLAMKNFSHPGNDQPEPADINTNIENTVTVAQNEWKYIAEMHLQLEKNLPPVNCYANELNQVFLNLILNSVHAIGAKLEGRDNEKGAITISTRKVDTSVEISIADTGSGIPDEIKDKIFEPFFTTKEVGEGTGQGLAIANDVIVNKHHGTLEVQSQPGQGSIFRITLPISRQEDA